MSARGFLALALGVLALAPPVRAQTVSRELPLTVATVAGRVEVRPAGGEWAVAKLKDQVGPGASARALAAGRMTLRGRGGHALRLGQLSQVTVPEAPGPAGDAPVSVRLDGGYLWVAVGPGAVSAAAFEIKVGGMTVSAYSGGVGIALGADGGAVVRVYHGRVVCRGGGWERTVTAGEELRATGDQAPDGPRTLTRDRVDAAWVRWNREQDLAGGYGGSSPR